MPSPTSDILSRFIHIILQQLILNVNAFSIFYIINNIGITGNVWMGFAISMHQRKRGEKTLAEFSLPDRY